MKGVFQNLIEANGSLTGVVVNLTEAHSGARAQGIDIDVSALNDCLDAAQAATEIISDMIAKLEDAPCYLESGE